MPTRIAAAALLAAFFVAYPDAWPRAGESAYGAMMSDPAARNALESLARAEESRRLDAADFAMLVGDGNALMRLRCAEALGRIGDPAGVPLLVRLIEDRDDEVVEAAVLSLGLLGCPESIEPLRYCLAEKPRPVRRRALEALARNGEREAGAVILPYLRNFHASVRTAAAEALAHLGDSASVGEIMLNLGDPDRRARAAAAYALGRLGCKAAVDRIATLLGDGDQEVRLRAAEALGRLEAERHVDRIALLLGDADRWTAVKAAEALGRIATGESAARLVPLLGSPDAYLRSLALDGIAASERRDLYDAVAPLAKDPSAMVRRSALAAAAATGGGRARGLLFEAANRGTPTERYTAVARLGGIGDPEDLPLLVSTLLHETDIFRLEGAAQALGDWEDEARLHEPLEAGNERTTPVEALLGAADGEDFVVASIAVESLGRRAREAGVIDRLVSIYRTHELRAGGTTTGAVSSKAAHGAGAEGARPGGGAADDALEDADRRLAILGAIPLIAAKCHLDEEDRAELAPFLASAALDGDPRIVRAALDAAADLGLEMDAGDQGPWLRGSPPWNDPSLPMGTHRILLSTTRGEIEIELFGDDAPSIVRNILSLAQSGFYESAVFHRVVPGFVIQGGCPRGDGWGDAGYMLRSEFNRHRYGRGMVGMAHSGKDTPCCQIFVTQTPQPHLDGGYTIIGRVARGMDAVDRIEVGDAFRITILD